MLLNHANAIYQEWWTITYSCLEWYSQISLFQVNCFSKFSKIEYVNIIFCCRIATHRKQDSWYLNYGAIENRIFNGMDLLNKLNKN